MADQTAAKPAAPAGKNERISVCGGRYEVFLGNPLPHFSSPGTRAYAAQGTRGHGSALALIVEKGEFPRFEILGNAVNINSPYVCKFLEYDVVYWADIGQHVPVLIYERPGGPRLMEKLTDERPPLNNEVHFRQLLESMADGVRDIYLAGTNHGRINPTNLFTRDASSATVQIGDYIATAPCKYQHPAYCTIELAMSHPLSRGPASASDDIYAMGVTLMHMIFGKLPMVNMAVEDIIKAKIEKGSLMALSGGLRIPSAYSEILRGLLADDVSQRWALDDIAYWLGGRRMGSKPGAQNGKAQRAFEIGGAAYNNVRLLAHAMTKQPDAAAKSIEDGSLDRWLRRSLGNEELAGAVAEAVASAASTQRGGSPAERAVTRTTITMDPSGPIRFRDISSMPQGLGALLVDTLAQGKSPRNIADFIAAQFILHWGNSQNLVGEYASIMQTYEGQRMLLDRPQPGFGIERVAYELSPGTPCLSPMVVSAFPLTLKSMMVALEAYASTVEAGDTRSDPIDRHIAAFILSRHRRMNDRVFPMLAAGTNAGQKALATLTVLAEMQRKYHTEPLPHLAEWVARMLAPSMDRFHNKILRERVARDINKLAKRGDISGMLSVMDDGSTQKKDDEGYNAAHKEWLILEKAARELTTNTEVRDKALLRQGRQVTAFVAALLGIIAIVITAFIKMV